MRDFLIFFIWSKSSFFIRRPVFIQRERFLVFDPSSISMSDPSNVLDYRFCFRGSAWVLWMGTHLHVQALDWTEPARSFFKLFFYSLLVSVSVFMALSTVFYSVNSSDNSAFSLWSSGLISALLVPSTIYLFMKVSLSPDDYNPLWLTGLKAPTN